MPFEAAADRYQQMQYRRLGRSGLDVPVISLGLWQNFGHSNDFATQRAIILRAFDAGITHFDLGNNYGPPNGAAEEVFGEVVRRDLAPYRDELVVTTKAGWGMWAGPYGTGGSRKYMLASLDQSLRRLGLDFVDVFYSHRPTPDTPLEETMGALHSAVTQGKATYVGISSYGAEMTAAAADVLDRLGTPLLVNQPSYSMLNRWIEEGLLNTLAERGVGCVVFSPLAQGLLTSRYLDADAALPADGRAARAGTEGNEFDGSAALSEENLERVRALNAIAANRGQSLAQMALAWTLRLPGVASAIIGARTLDQLDDSLRSLESMDFQDDEIRKIDEFAVEGGIDLWRSTASIRP
jgi:L-glyceraldehyde 3-phosphate reductase